MHSFNPNQTIKADELNTDFTGLADGTLIEDNAITSTHLATEEAWTEVTYQNSWVAYDAGTQYGGIKYMKDNMGFVHLKGLAKNGTSSTAGIFTLPVGYRPERREIVPAMSNGYVRFNLEVDGICKINSGGSTTYVSVAGIMFYAG